MDHPDPERAPLNPPEVSGNGEKQTETEKDRDREYHYQQTFLQGRYCEMPSALPAMARMLAQKDTLKTRTDSQDQIIPPKKRRRRCCNLARLWRSLVVNCEDWVYLALLGMVMAILSFIMDYAIEGLGHLHMIIYNAARGNQVFITYHLTYFVWILYTIILTLCSALLAHYIAPQAIGSGIPEMKTILRGVILKEYLTFRTLVAKMIGLTLSLGSGLPIGKEGPFVHVASVVANLMSHLAHHFKGVYENESRTGEMLAAGCAVGVACTFSAPIGGVLFSIEVTSVYFAVRNYWRGFFAATCSATVFRILRLIFNHTDVTMTAFFQTEFPHDAYVAEELPFFALIGVWCGVSAAAFIALHRRIVKFLRRNNFARSVFQKYWLIYPAFVSLIVSSLTYPLGFGDFIAGEVKFGRTLADFFCNCTFTAEANTSAYCSDSVRHHWMGADLDHSVYVSLVLFQVVFFLLAVLSSTLPVPAGIFMPVFVLGASFGRTIGELMSHLYPDGFHPDKGESLLIYPGVYAVVGAAAFCGGVTHTVSVAVIVFELTGQLFYILPVMIAVLISIAVCSYLQPSIYDSMIKIKHLPFLPDIPHSSSEFHHVRVKQIMVSEVKFVAKDSTVREVQDLVLSMTGVKSFPVVQNKENMILLGSIGKSQLHKFLEAKVGMKARQAEAARRVREAISYVDHRFKIAHQQAPPSAPAIAASQSLDNILDATTPPRKTGNRFTVVPVPKKKEAEEPTLSERKDSNMTGSQNEQLNGTHPTVGPFLSDEDKEAIFAMGKKRNVSNGSLSSSDGKEKDHHGVYHTIGGVFRSLSKFSFHRHRKQPPAHEFDLYGDDRALWEQVVLNERVDLSTVTIDPAPFQLVENTSLFKMHSLFSLLGLERAYVTRCGRLCGVVALKELRVAIGQVQDGLLCHKTKAGGLDDEDDEGDYQKREETDSDSDFEDNLQPRLEVISRANTVSSVGELIDIDKLPTNSTSDVKEAKDLKAQQDEFEADSERQQAGGSMSASPVQFSEELAGSKRFDYNIDKVPTINIEKPTSSTKLVAHENPAYSPSSSEDTQDEEANEEKGIEMKECGPNNGNDSQPSTRLTTPSLLGILSRSDTDSSLDDGSRPSSPRNPLRPKKHVKIVMPSDDDPSIDKWSYAENSQTFKKRPRK